MSSINSQEDSFGKGDSSVETPLSKVQFSGESNQYIILGGKKYHRHELLTAFAGTMQVERYSTGPTHLFANPAPVGLAGFGLTTVVLGLYLSGVKGIAGNQIIVGCTTFCGGVLLFLSGCWEMATGNTFGATAFVSYGAFWFSFGVITIPAFNIAAAYGDDVEQLNNAFGFWLLGWVIFTTICFSFTLKATWAFVITFGVLDVTLVVLTAFYFTGNAKVMKAGGILAVITGFLGWYCMYGGIANRSNTYLVPPTWPMPLIGLK